MSSILGKWVRHGIKMDIKKDTIKTSLYDAVADHTRTLHHDYIAEADKIQLYSPTVRDIKHAFKGELRVVVLTPYTMTIETEGGITNWNREEYHG